MRQFVWCLPAQPLKWDQVGLLAGEIARRVTGVARGFVPADFTQLTAAVDLGKYLIHWILVAWKPDSTGHVVDYGRLEVPSVELGVEQGLLNALRQFKDLVMGGFPQLDGQGKPIIPRQVWIDAGYMTPVVYTFCRESGSRFRPTFGRGTSQQRTQWYNRPTNTGSVVKIIGEGFHFNLQTAERILSVEVDADYWKTWVHERLATPLETPGALSLYQGTPQDHLALSKHLTAETKTEEFVAGKGLVVRWERQQRQNHWLDALYNASAAGRHCGARLLEEAQKSKPPVRYAAVPDEYVRPSFDYSRYRFTADINLRPR
jgi:phage terminase large subunit GpA-like protein